MSRFSVVFGYLLFSVLLAASPVTRAMLPEGWDIQGQPRVFNGNDLYGYINGGSELFLEFGFNRLTAYRLQSPAGELVLDLYEMTDPVGALGIYLAKCSPETPVAGLDVRNSGDKYQLAVLKGRWFAFIQNHAGDSAYIPDMKRLAVILNGHLDGTVAAFPVFLPAEGLVETSRRLARGPYALQPVYTLGEGNLLSLGGHTVAAIGDYERAGSSWTLIRVTYPNSSAARAGFVSLVAKLDSYLDPVTQSDTRLVFRDYADRFGEAVLNDEELDIRVHLDRIPE